jgi:hypothetical protein
MTQATIRVPMFEYETLGNRKVLRSGRSTEYGGFEIFEAEEKPSERSPDFWGNLILPQEAAPAPGEITPRVRLISMWRRADGRVGGVVSNLKEPEKVPGALANRAVSLEDPVGDEQGLKVLVLKPTLSPEEKDAARARWGGPKPQTQTAPGPGHENEKPLDTNSIPF